MRITRSVLVGVGQALGPLLSGFLGDAYSSLGPAYVLSGGVFIAGAVAALLLPTPPKH